MAWAKLKHDKAIQVFHCDISAEAFTNPSARKAVLAAAKGQQLKRCDQRMRTYLHTTL